ncbi:hypothetical protein ACFW88_14930 [Streptomyces anandii]|uniref:Uncharacterized protein n=1 Tax=Streptomyces anandii TaxID=285454 RepID=A0ABW6H5B3_9ACTN
MGGTAGRGTLVRGSVVRGVLAAVVLALVAAVAGPVPGVAVAAGTPGPYDFAPGDRDVEGARTTADARLLEPGSTYRSSLPRGGKLYYRLDLDAATTAYVSATAVPAAGSTVSATDGLQVSVRDAQGTTCSFQATRFGASRSPHPVAAWGAREASPGHALCQGRGTYYVLVERADATGSSPDTWPLELSVATEPPLEHTGATTAPDTWNSASPAPPDGRAVNRAGGSGFAGASPVGQGVWKDRLRPGQTVFYRVPVDWGQQLAATAELAGSGGRGGYAEGALTLSLYNPVRGYVEEAYAGYSGTPASAALAPLPPVAYANRYGFADPVKGMRFAGSYYLAVHLAAQTAGSFGPGPYGLTLRVRVDGTARSGPGYTGRSVPGGLFEVTDQDRRAAAASGAGNGGTAGLRVLAVGGIGAGTVILAVLGVWTVLARRGTPQMRASAQKPTA